ncbi:putative methyltransferase C1B3.06c [Colletotrichum tanaceti]|uniref:Putative methyltransferase C1B3.06c n=1 Tax=Colletotrichum tanaceti TaxID=1306861 RepID=A0A4U6XHE2_9PEZI|nr:putative methyltransferase C1B3.06c [Colletotrichum tanaceti]TKW55348.1 putative methyltransferase C1B3.06c [Colletotrichum tanaceti]
MSYTSGHIQADHPTVMKAYDYRTAESCCAYLIPHLQPHYSILDVGCGPGNITEGLAKLCPQGKTIGVDISQGVVRHATSRYCGPGGVPNLSFQLGDAGLLEQFRDDSFDVVHAHGCLLHVADKIQSLKAFLRVCKPGGIVAVRDAVSFGTIWSLKPDLRAIREQWAKQREALLCMGSDPDTGMKKKEWAAEAGYEENGGRVFVSQSPQRMDVALRNFEGEMAEGAIENGFLTRQQVDGFKAAWDEWESTEGHELICPAADMLCFKGKEVSRSV